MLVKEQDESEEGNIPPDDRLDVAAGVLLDEIPFLLSLMLQALEVWSFFRCLLCVYIKLDGVKSYRHLSTGRQSEHNTQRRGKRKRNEEEDSTEMKWMIEVNDTRTRMKQTRTKIVMRETQTPTTNTSPVVRKDSRGAEH